MLLDYQKETGTKYIDSSFGGVPALENSYGSLSAILKTILTEPYNIKSILSLNVVGDFLQIGLEPNHGFYKDQVVMLSGNTDAALNSEFRILEHSQDLLTILKPEGLLEEPLDLINIRIAGAPLGYSVVYEDTLSGTICLKNGSKKSPGILKVIDKLPPNDYDPAWSKFVRVSIGVKIDSEGNFVNNFKTPYHGDFPDVELTGNNVKGPSGIHGFAKWHISKPASTSCIEMAEPTGYFPTRWKLIGDDKNFYLMIHTSGMLDSNNFSFDVVGFGNFYSYNPLESLNICLQAKDGFYSANSSPHSNPSRCSSFFGALGHSSSGFILTDSFGSNRCSYGRCTSVGRFLSNSNPQFPWRSSDVKSHNLSSREWSTTPLIIKDSSNYIRGEYRGVQIICGPSKLPDSYVSSEGDLSIHVQEPANTTAFNTINMIFTLKNWEEIL